MPYDDAIPRLNGWENKPVELDTRTVWERKYDRKVKKGETPQAILLWGIERKRYVPPGGTLGDRSATVTRTIEVPLYAFEQTRKFKPDARTLAFRELARIFLRYSSKRHYLWQIEGAWKSCLGNLTFDHFLDHLKQKEIYGVRNGGKGTNFGGIDLDLHNGDPALFLEQLNALLDEFHGRDGWHFQVADQNAGGVHLFQVFSKPQPYQEYRDALRAKLVALNTKYPDLAKRAKEAGMKSLGEMEIFPNTQAGLRLPFCRNRTMLIDAPLAQITHRKKSVVDVERYIRWVDTPNKQYMPRDEVFNYIQTRLRPRTVPISDNIQDIDTVNNDIYSGTTVNKQRRQQSARLLKNNYALNIQQFWSGIDNMPDSLNEAILILSNIAPYYFNTQDIAVSAIEKMIDDLPNKSFSDRLSSGNRAAVSRVVNENVSSAFANHSSPSSNSIESRQLLDITFQKWSGVGFNPFDSTTWKVTAGAMKLGPDFDWTPEELQKLDDIRAVLKTDISTTAAFVKFILRLISGHDGEIAISLIEKQLLKHGIKVGSDRNRKASTVIRILKDWNWIIVREEHRWHVRQTDKSQSQGKARRYGIHKDMHDRFGGGESPILMKKELKYLLLHYQFDYQPFTEEEQAAFVSEYSRLRSKDSDVQTLTDRDILALADLATPRR